MGAVAEVGGGSRWADKLVLEVGRDSRGLEVWARGVQRWTQLRGRP